MRNKLGLVSRLYEFFYAAVSRDVETATFAPFIVQFTKIIIKRKKIIGAREKVAEDEVHN